MTCKALLYTNSDIDVLIKINDLAFESTDVQDLIIVLEIKSGGSISRSYSIDTGEIVASGNDFIMSIPRTDITTSGKYKIKITMIDQNGNHRGITPCTNTDQKDCLEFVNA